MKVLMWLNAVLVVLVAGAHADVTYTTPEIRGFEVIDMDGALAYVMRGELGGSGQYVGLGIVCRSDGSRAAEVTAYFGSFPGVGHPVQLAVRGAGGRVGRFGPVVSAGPESGFHSPRITDPGEAARFVSLALQTGSLISNGYRSFWNRVDEARNREVREAFVACARGSVP